MNKVEPIRSIEKIDEMKKFLGTDRNVIHRLQLINWL